LPSRCNQRVLDDLPFGWLQQTHNATVKIKLLGYFDSFPFVSLADLCLSSTLVVHQPKLTMVLMKLVVDAIVQKGYGPFDV
jgi:hypothetical protein